MLRVYVRRIRFDVVQCCCMFSVLFACLMLLLSACGTCESGGCGVREGEGEEGIYIYIYIYTITS